MLTLEKGVKLVRLARHAIETLLYNMPLSIDHYKEFDEKKGVYVTLKKNGKLRGQMGVIETKDELYQAVVKAARDAAFNDKRFEPVTKEEIHEIEIEVTIITNSNLLRVSSFQEYAKHIHIGIDGVAIVGGVYSAVLLPNAEMTYGWDTERLLRYLSNSAGMTMDAWKTLNHKIYVFQCQTFAEKNEKIIEII